MQLGQEMTKQKSTKCEQSTDKLYSSNWIQCNILALLVPVIGALKSRGALNTINLQENENKKR